jgi:hypothetical protein
MTLAYPLLGPAIPVRIELADPEFFSANPKKLRVEDNPGTGRIYFILKGRIVAVGKPAARPTRSSMAEYCPGFASPFCRRRLGHNG